MADRPQASASEPPIARPPENKPDPRPPAPPQDIKLTYEEKDWTQPVDPKATVNEDLRSGKIVKNGPDIPTATLPITDVRGLGESIQVELGLEDARAVPGEEVRGHVYVGSGKAQAGVGFVLALPAGADYVAESSPHATYDAKSNEITWQFDLDETGLATLPFALRVLPDAKRGALTLTLKAKDDKRYVLGPSKWLNVAASETIAEIGEKGGKLAVGERVVLDFGPGALKEAQSFAASLYTQAPGDYAPLVLKVTPDTQFETPITATINLSGLIPAEMLVKGMVPELRYARFGELDVEQTDARGEKRRVKVEGVDYEVVPGYWDAASQSLSVQLSHFSEYPIGFSAPKGAPEPWKLNANLGDVSLFRGSMNWSLPIAVPGFPNGAPGLSIAYSSASADSSSGRMASSDYRLGWGWDLNGVPQIQQGMKANPTGPGSGTSWYEVLADNQYRLSLGGRDYNLIYKNSISNTATYADEYVPEDYAPVRVVRCRVGFNCNGHELPSSVVPAWNEFMVTAMSGSCGFTEGWAVPSEQYYWQAWTSDGTRYVFGTDASSTMYMQRRNGIGGRIKYRKWFLTKVADLVRDNPAQNKWSAEYSYEEDERGSASGQHLTEGQGAGNNFKCDGRGADWEERTRLTQVTYGNSQAALSRPYTVTLNYTTPYANWKRLSGVTVQSNNTDLRRYVFGFSGAAWDARLSSITEQGWNGSAWVQLPDTTFAYKSDNSNDISSSTEYKYGLVTTINNGYGGSIETDYQFRSAPFTYAPYNVVPQQRFKDGLGNTSVALYDFVDSTRCFNDITNNTPSACNFERDTLFPESRNKLMGFSTVWKSVLPSGGSALSVTRYDQHHNKRYLGKPATVRAYNAAKTSVLSTQVNYYGLTEPAPGQPTGTWLTWLGTQDDFPLGDATYDTNTEPLAGVLMKRTETSVDGLGNPLSVYEHGYWHATGDERSTHRGYVHNWDDWVVSKLAWEGLYASITSDLSSNTFRNHTLLYYDTHWLTTDTPTFGQLTKVGRGNSGLGGANWAVQDFAYDAAGNLNRIVDGRGYTSTARYDDATLKPVQITNTLGHTSTYIYFGRPPATQPAGQPWGEYHYTIDPNGQQVNRVWYDPYGRAEKVIQPGDSDAQPTLTYTYGDAGLPSVAAPLKIETQQRENCNGCTIVSQAYYDGLGRAVQTRAEAPSSQQRVTNLTYDALGRALRQYVPVFEAAGNYNRPSGWDAKPNTLNSYDLLGRTVQVVGPDGVTTTLGYDSANTFARTTLTRTLNMSGTLKVPQHSLSDGLGQLRQVQECHDANLDDGVQCTWQTTTYTYDVAFGLTSVVDALNNTTSSMSYDALGRKGAMSDMDMGYWAYVYDGNGNLTRQTDAKNQTIDFTYDALNRMTDKTVGGVWTSWNRYDGVCTAVNGVGRRTCAGLATWLGSNWSNVAYWQYNARGQVSQEQRYVDGAGWYNTSYTYDSADRISTMTYPDNEVVTTAYDAAGLPTSLGGSNTYVSSASYNALGQPTVFDLGNTLSQRLYYYGSNLSAPYVNANGNTNWNYGKLRQNCVLTTSLGACWDWTVRPSPNTKNALLNLYYNYDDAGNVHEIDDLNNGGTSNTVHLYDYDAIDRLTQWTMSSAVQETYSYNAIGNMTNKSNVGNYQYAPWFSGCASKLHAPGIAGGNGYCYDLNGNNEWRLEAGKLYRQYWNADNKLVQVDEHQYAGAWPYLATRAQFYYDADSARVKSVVNGVTTAYVGQYFEQNLNTTVTTKYYYFGGQRVALRTSSGTLNWLHSDHLGSASLATTSSGGTVANSSQRYKPFGELRVAGSGQPSKYTFTGSYDFMSIGLLDYGGGTRFYSPLLGRFTSADSIVPGAGNPQNLNRYSYVGNSPLNFTDPTGHCAANHASGDSWCREEWATAEDLKDYGVQLQDQVKAGDLDPVEALAKLSDRTWAAFDHSVNGYMWAMTLLLMGIDARVVSPAIFYMPPNNNDEQVKTRERRGWSHYWLKLYWLPFEYDKQAPPQNDQVSEIGDWKGEYFDGSSNQAYHFWAYVSIGYYGIGNIGGPLLAQLGNAFHDPPWGGGNGVSKVDNALGVTGAQFASHLRNPTLTCSGFLACAWVQPSPSDWIRENLKS